MQDDVEQSLGWATQSRSVRDRSFKYFAKRKLDLHVGQATASKFGP